MEKETFILQTTRAGRLPMNAVFIDEGVARAETERAQKSGAFEHIKLVHLVGTEKKVLTEFGRPSGTRQAGGKGRAEPERARTKQITSAQLINRISLFVTLGLIGAVLIYAVESVMTK